jgi:hypothetical protein
LLANGWTNMVCKQMEKMEGVNWQGCMGAHVIRWRAPLQSLHKNQYSAAAVWSVCGMLRAGKVSATSGTTAGLVYLYRKTQCGKDPLWERPLIHRSGSHNFSCVLWMVEARLGTVLCFDICKLYLIGVTETARQLSAVHRNPEFAHDSRA